MFNCKHCSTENESGNVYCSNCGDILANANENEILYCLKSMGRGIISPASYLRNALSLSKVQLWMMIGILATTIVIANGLLPLLTIPYFTFKLAMKMILTGIIKSGLGIVVSVGVSYGVIKLLKKEIDAVQLLNVVVSATAITSVLKLIPSLFTTSISIVAAIIGATFGIVYFSMIAIALKDNFKLKTKEVFIVIVLSIIASLLFKSLVGKIF